MKLYIKEDSYNDKFIIAMCNHVVDYWDMCSYGIPINGKLEPVPTPEYFDKHWHLLSPEEFAKYKGGICYDNTMFGADYLNESDIEYKQYYLYTDMPNEDTHTFIVIPYKDKFIYIEGAFKYLAQKIDGMKIFDTEEQIFKFITKAMFKVNDNIDLDSFNYYVFEFTGYPPYGCNALEFTEYCTKNNTVYEGTAYNSFKKNR